MGIKKRRILSGCTVVFVCVSILLSFVFIAGYAVHECSHDGECPVCRAIDICMHTIRGAVSGNPVGAALAVVLMTCAAVLFFAAVIRYSTTLISLKVELRN